MRIIAGIHRGRKLISSTGAGIRPTASKMRTAIFNILSSGSFIKEDGSNAIENAKVIDLCCGTGALGIESISRGAAKVVFIDGSSQHLKIAWENICQLDEQTKAIMIRAKAEYLPQARELFDLVFIDPPYFKGIANKALLSLIEKNWLANDAVIVVELPKQEDIIFNPEYYREIVTKNYGNSKFILLKRLSVETN